MSETNTVDRIRELTVAINNAGAELATLYGPLWHEMESLRRAANEGGVASLCALIEALERGDKLAYTGNLVVTDPDTERTVQMVLDEDDFAALKMLAAAQPRHAAFCDAVTAEAECICGVTETTGSEH